LPKKGAKTGAAFKTTTGTFSQGGGFNVLSSSTIKIGLIEQKPDYCTGSYDLK